MIKSKRSKDTNFQNLKQKFQNNIIKIQLEYFRMQSELKTIFNQVDNDNDNSTLNFTEFATILKNFNQNLSFRDQKELFDLFDEDQSGLISQDEFIQILFNTSFAEQKDNQILFKMKAQRIIKKIKGIIVNDQISVDQLFRRFEGTKKNQLTLEEFRKLF